jgi:hypothetical protein
MSLLKKIDQLKRLDGLIRRKSTGSASELASRLNISERNVFHLLNQIKELGAPVYFCRVVNSYCYQRDVSFKFGFLPTNESQQVKGGATNIFISDFFKTANLFQ